MLRTSDVTACLVTRGDQREMVSRIVDSLIFDRVLIWNNAERDDVKTAGRFYATLEASTGVVYFQDDDVLVPRSTQLALLDAYEPGIPTAVYAHGENPAGYDDLPLVCGGALVDRSMPWTALNRYLDFYPADDAFLYDCDFIAGVLYPMFKHIHQPFDIDLAIAQAPERLCNQPFQKDMKLLVTERARGIRDMAVAA
jgi:hypothetical protein